MEFGIGFVSGGVLAGLAVAKGGTVVKAAHLWLSKTEASIHRKVDAKVAALKSKL
jgi:hypothetical protein